MYEFKESDSYPDWEGGEEDDSVDFNESGNDTYTTDSNGSWDGQGNGDTTDTSDDEGQENDTTVGQAVDTPSGAISGTASGNENDGGGATWSDKETTDYKPQADWFGPYSDKVNDNDTGYTNHDDSDKTNETEGPSVLQFNDDSKGKDNWTHTVVDTYTNDPTAGYQIHDKTTDTDIGTDSDNAGDGGDNVSSNGGDTFNDTESSSDHYNGTWVQKSDDDNGDSTSSNTTTIDDGGQGQMSLDKGTTADDSSTDIDEQDDATNKGDDNFTVHSTETDSTDDQGNRTQTGSANDGYNYDDTAKDVGGDTGALADNFTAVDTAKENETDGGQWTITYAPDGTSTSSGSDNFSDTYTTDDNNTDDGTAGGTTSGVPDQTDNAEGSPAPGATFGEHDDQFSTVTFSGTDNADGSGNATDTANGTDSGTAMDDVTAVDGGTIDVSTTSSDHWNTTVTVNFNADGSMSGGFTLGDGGTDSDTDSASGSGSGGMDGGYGYGGGSLTFTESDGISDNYIDSDSGNISIDAQGNVTGSEGFSFFTHAGATEKTQETDDTGDGSNGGTVDDVTAHATVGGTDDENDYGSLTFSPSGTTGSETHTINQTGTGSFGITDTESIPGSSSSPGDTINFSSTGSSNGTVHDTATVTLAADGTTSTTETGGDSGSATFNVNESDTSGQYDDSETDPESWDDSSDPGFVTNADPPQQQGGSGTGKATGLAVTVAPPAPVWALPTTPLGVGDLVIISEHSPVIEASGPNGKPGATLKEFQAAAKASGFTLAPTNPDSLAELQKTINRAAKTTKFNRIIIISHAEGPAFSPSAAMNEEEILNKDLFPRTLAGAIDNALNTNGIMVLATCGYYYEDLDMATGTYRLRDGRRSDVAYQAAWIGSLAEMAKRIKHPVYADPTASKPRAGGDGSWRFLGSDKNPTTTTLTWPRIGVDQFGNRLP